MARPLVDGDEGYLATHRCIHQRHLPPAFRQSDLFLYSDIDPLTEGLAEGVAPDPVDGAALPPPVDMPPLPVVPDGVPPVLGLPEPPEVPLPVDPPVPLDPAPEEPAAPPLVPLPDPDPPPA